MKGMVFLFISLCFMTVSLTARDLTLEQARAYALEHAYDLRTSRIDTEIARQQRKEAFSTGLPQLLSSFSYNNNMDIATSLIPNFFEGKPDELIEVQFGTKYNSNLHFALEQLVFSGSYWVALKSSKVFQDLSEKQMEMMELDIIQAVSDTYCLGLVADKNLALLKDSQKNLETTLHETSERYKEGFVEETDVDQIQISLNGVKNSIRSAERQIENIMMLLKFQMGLELEEDIQLVDSLDYIVDDAVGILAVKPDLDLEQNTSIKFARTSQRIEELKLLNEKFKRVPELSAYLNFDFNAMEEQSAVFSNDVHWYRSTTFGIKITFPNFTSGVTKARISQAKLDVSKAEIQTKKAEETLKSNFISVRNNLINAFDNYKLAGDSLKLSEKVYKNTEIKYSEGMATSMELVQAHDRFLEKQAEYLTEMSTLLTSRYSFSRILELEKQSKITEDSEGEGE